MSLDVKKVEYYHATVEDHITEGANMLSAFAGVGINWLAFKAVSLEPWRTRFTLFPDDSSKMAVGAEKAGLALDGPHPALLIKGDSDDSGDLAGIYAKLSQAGIEVHESTGIADIRESYGVVLYLKPEDCDKALAALKI